MTMNSLPSDEGSIHTSAAISQPAIIPARNFCIGGFCIICSDMTITALCTSVPRTPVKDVKAREDRTADDIGAQHDHPKPQQYDPPNQFAPLHGGRDGG